MSFFPTTGNRIAGKVLPRFPARILTDAGLKVTVSGGAHTFGFDYPALSLSSGISDPTKAYLQVLNVNTGAYERIRADQIVLPAAGVRTPRGDANYAMVTTDRFVALTATLTAPRVFTLPAASGVTGGTAIAIADEAGGVSATNTLTIQRAAADTINGATTYVLNAARQALVLVSDGASKWTIDGAFNITNIAAGSVTNASLANMAASTFKANNTGSAASPADITVAQAQTLLGLGVMAYKATVATGDLVDASVTTVKIADANVTTVKIADSNVTTAKIADANVTHPKVATGFVIDRAYANYSTYTAIGQIPFDDTIPQNTEGAQIVSVTITPKSTTNILRCIFLGNGGQSNSADDLCIAAMFKNSDASAMKSGLTYSRQYYTGVPCIIHEFVPGSTSLQTISVRMGSYAASTMFVNGTSTSRTFGGSLGCTLIVEEIKA